MVFHNLRLALDPARELHLTDVGAVGEDRAYARLRDLDPLRPAGSGSAHRRWHPLRAARIALPRAPPSTVISTTSLPTLFLPVAERRPAGQIHATRGGTVDRRLEVRARPPQIILRDHHPNLKWNSSPGRSRIDAIVHVHQPPPGQLQTPIGQRALNQVTPEPVQIRRRSPPTRRPRPAGTTAPISAPQPPSRH